MASWDDRLHKVLDGYAKFLRENDLALAKQQPYLVRWVLMRRARRIVVTSTPMLTPWSQRKR